MRRTSTKVHLHNYPSPQHRFRPDDWACFLNNFHVMTTVTCCRWYETTRNKGSWCVLTSQHCYDDISKHLDAWCDRPWPETRQLATGVNVLEAIARRRLHVLSLLVESTVVEVTRSPQHVLLWNTTDAVAVTSGNVQNHISYYAIYRLDSTFTRKSTTSNI